MGDQHRSLSPNWIRRDISSRGSLACVTVESRPPSLSLHLFHQPKGLAMKRHWLFILVLIFCAARWSCADPTASVPVDPLASPNALNVPLKVGTTWTYGHSYSYYDKSGTTLSRRGVHTWTLTAADTVSIPHIYQFIAHTDDSVHHVKVTSTVWDSTYRETADIPFTGAMTSDSLTIRWLVTLGRTSHEDVQRVPLILAQTENLYRVVIGANDVFGSDATYQAGKGLISFKAWLGPVMSGNYTDSLGLRSVVVP